MDYVRHNGVVMLSSRKLERVATQPSARLRRYTQGNFSTPSTMTKLIFCGRMSRDEGGRGGEQGLRTTKNHVHVPGRHRKTDRKEHKQHLENGKWDRTYPHRSVLFCSSCKTRIQEVKTLKTAGASRIETLMDRQVPHQHDPISSAAWRSCVHRRSRPSG